MNKKLLTEFADPPNAYRAKPFWAWNGELDPDELRRQVRVMQRMGMGGFFMHSRLGLETEYLGEDWFKCIEACVDEAGRLGMEAWLYDEDRWPSGSAGGIATRDPRHRMRYLAMEQVDDARKLRWNGDCLAAFAAQVSGNTASGVRRLRRGSRIKLARGELILRFSVRTAPESTWYNGATYLDTMSPAAVRHFIGTTHEQYRRRFGRHFGKAIPGIFTDEPNHGTYFFPIQDTNDGHSVPWTPKLPAVFRRRYGYDVLDHLPELFLDVDGEAVSAARYHFHDCTTHLFVEAYARVIGEWCEKHKLVHTGHVLHEPTLSWQTVATGSVMRSYEYMQAPGMDLLTQYWREYDTAKQVSSAARQFGRRWRLTETYGCTGWDFPFLGHKAVGDWQAAMGINLRCQHLSWYTMAGDAKRDYPASIFYQSPWWEAYGAVEDYFARVHVAMGRGEEVRDLLVVHPVESMWLLCRRGWYKDWDPAPHVDRLNRMLADLRDGLLAANIDFDYGDEDILARHGKVSRRGGAVELAVGRARYTTVLVPPQVTIRATTLALLKRFRAAGGTVIFTDPVPRHVDARRSDAAREIAADGPVTRPKGAAPARAVEPTARRLSIADGESREIVPAMHLLRADREAYYLFVCNVGHDFRGKAMDPHVHRRRMGFDDVRIRGLGDAKGAPVELDPATGETGGADTRRRGGDWEIRTSLPPVGSRLFVVPRRGGKRGAAPKRRSRDLSSRSIRRARWPIALSECNNLVLDRPRYRIGRGGWRAADEILRIEARARAALGLPKRTWKSLQPWADKHPAKLKSIPVALSYEIDVQAPPSGDLYLGIENPRRYEATLNGLPLATDTDCGWWCDRSLRRIPVPASCLRQGTNTLELRCAYDAAHPSLEAVYLLGQFGVRVRGTEVTMTEAPTHLKPGDWTRQGLAFYSGSVTYSTTVRPALRGRRRLVVQVPDFKGVAVRVLVNGETAGVIGWPPYELDITERLDGEPFTLGIEVLGHRRNSHGPLHLNEREPQFYGPDEFITTGKRWSDDYRLVPVGLMKAPKLVVRG